MNHLLIAAFGGLMVWFGVKIMVMTKLSTMPATKLPSSVLYVILPLAGTLVLISGILVAAKQDKKLLADTAGEEEPHA